MLAALRWTHLSDADCGFVLLIRRRRGRRGRRESPTHFFIPPSDGEFLP